MSTFFGLDFGTSNSTLAVNLNGAVKLLEIDPINVNPFSLKSILFFDEYTKILKFGQEAVDSYLENDALGRYIQSIKSFLPDKTFISTDVSGKSLNISDLVAIILREIKSRGEQIVGEEIGKIVLGRPVVFSVDKVADNLAEKRLLEAAKKAGFSDISFVFEPVAAAKACIVKSDVKEERIVLVGDFGGGTSDFALVRKKRLSENVLSVSGVHMGGNDFDSLVMWNKITKYFGRFAKIRSMGGIITGSDEGMCMPNSIMRELCQWHKIPKLKNPKMRGTIAEYEYLVDPLDIDLIKNLECLIDDNYGYMLFRSIEAAKIALSEREIAQILFSERNLTISESLEKSEFEEMLLDFGIKIEESVDNLLLAAGVGRADVDIVSLTGGSSMIPFIQSIFFDKFGKNKVFFSDAFTSVACGLAM